MSRSWPLRRRLLVALVALCAVGLAAFAGFGVLLLERSLTARADARLLELADGMRHGPPPPPDDARDALPLPTDFSIHVYSRSGVLLWQEPEGGTNGPAIPAELVNRSSTSPVTLQDRLRDVEWRATTVGGPDGERLVLAVSLEEEAQTVNQLLLIELATGVLILTLVAGVGLVVVRLGLNPLTRMERTATAIADGNVDLRVADTDARTETGQLGRALNTMLERLGQALRDREHSEQRLRRFVADASHELRTPLTSIRGFAELYRHGQATRDPTAERIVRRVEDEAERMGFMVEDLLLLARLDREPALDLSDVDVGALASDVVHDARVRHPNASITLEESESRVRVFSDEHRLHQVLANLIGNAVTHSPDGTPVRVRTAAVNVTDPPPGTTTVGADLRPGTTAVRIEVHDDGPGIDAEHLPFLFDRFYRADPARSRGGTGLGLAIAAALVEAHGGRVEVDSAPSRGTTFGVLLPRSGPDSY